MYADDTKIYLVIKSFHSSLKLQHDINNLMQWSSVWLLRFNAAKCKVMQIGNSLPASYTMIDDTTNVSTDLELVNKEKDLGVWCTSVRLDITLDVWCSGLNSLKSNKGTYNDMILVYSAISSNSHTQSREPVVIRMDA